MASRAPEEPALEAELARLRERASALEGENAQLAEQVKRLLKAERDMCVYQGRLDTQLKVFTALYELGKRLDTTFVEGDIFNEMAEFVAYELEVQRCAVVTRARGGSLALAALAGDFSEDDEARLRASLESAIEPSSRRGPALYAAANQPTELSPMLRALGADEVAVFPVKGDEGEVMALLVASNQTARASPHARLHEGGYVMTGIANLISQAEAALKNARLYRALEGERQMLEQRVIARTAELSSAFRALDEKNRRLAEDLEQAYSFQQTMLPSLPRGAQLDFAAFYRPADVVGGDIYDVVVLEPGRFRMFLADTTGHGVQAALRTMVLKAEYDRIKLQAGDPAELLAMLNETLSSKFTNLELRCTACCLDIASLGEGCASVVYANAAHIPLLHLRGERVEEIYRPGAFAGMVGGVEFDMHRFSLAPGERLLAFTDGVVEQVGGEREMFGFERVKQVFSEPGVSLSGMVSSLANKLGAFSPDAELADDVTVVAVECVRANGG